MDWRDHPTGLGHMERPKTCVRAVKYVGRLRTSYFPEFDTVLGGLAELTLSEWRKGKEDNEWIYKALDNLLYESDGDDVSEEEEEEDEEEEVEEDEGGDGAHIVFVGEVKAGGE